MSIEIENHCVDCGLPCPYRDVLVAYCDDCGEDRAKYCIDGDDLCEDCAKARIKDVFYNKSTKERKKT